VRRPPAALAVTCASLALLATACGQSNLDTSGLEDQIDKTLSDRTGFTIKSVRCPDDVEAKKGGTFRCTVTTARGERAVVDVTQTDDKGGVTWKLAGPIKR
jgi:uncharacterized protein DUF4333